MPKVTRVAATTSATNPNAKPSEFLSGSAPGMAAPPVSPEPPMLDKGEPDGVDQQPPEPNAPLLIKENAAKIDAPVPIPPPIKPVPPAVVEPFTLLWSRETANEMSPDGRTVVKYGDKRSLRAAQIEGAGVLVKSSWVMANGTIAEAMCFVPGVEIFNGVLRMMNPIPKNA